jgi:U-box domain
MVDPVMLVESGNTYEREAILAWLEKKKTDPLTNKEIKNEMIVANHIVKSMISSFLQEHNNEFIEDTYLPNSLIQGLIDAMKKNDLKTFSDVLGKDPRLLNKDLQEEKNILMLGCESASLEILSIILTKLGASLLNFPGVKEDKGLALFLTACQRFLKESQDLGLKAAKILAKAFQWEPTDIQILFDTALKNNDMDMTQIALLMGADTSNLQMKAIDKKQNELQAKEKEGEQGSSSLQLLNLATTQKETEILTNKLALKEKIGIENLKNSQEEKSKNVEKISFPAHTNLAVDLVVKPRIAEVPEELSFFIVPSEIIDEQKGILREIKEKQRKHNEEKKFQAPQEQEKLEKHRKIQQTQGPFITALLEGDLEKAKELEQQGASLTEPNEQGLYPLVAAVYGTNLEAVEYIENKLQENAILQWKQVDSEKAKKEIESEMPEELKAEATREDLMSWYSKVSGQKKYCKRYDESCSLRLNGKSWYIPDWSGRSGDFRLVLVKNKIINKWPETEEIRAQIVLPSCSIHNEVVKQIREQLEKLRQKIEIYTIKQPVTTENTYTPIITTITTLQITKPKLTSQQQELQDLFIAALRAGDLEKAKRLVGEEGCLLLYPNKEGIYPLAAAVYGANWEAVKYIENELGFEESGKQWLGVNAKKALDIVDEAPSELRKEATYKELSQWFLASRGNWCKIYDRECLKREGRKAWSEEDWWKRGCLSIAMLNETAAR